MQYSSVILLVAFSSTIVFAHGVIDSITGANGVTMPGLSDGTPRDCATPACGAEADTSIIRENELGTSKATALGRNEGGGPVDPSQLISVFMGGNANSSAAIAAREIYEANLERRALARRGLFGLGQTGSGSASTGTKTAQGSVEAGVAAAAGAGTKSGLPTCADDGTVTLNFHQVNQDGAGPLTASVDGTSGGSDVSAFQTAEVTQNVPGIGIGGLSAVTTTDFPVTVQMPAGMTCSGTVGGASNVCIVKLQNSALAGPFGGSAAFTQSAAAKKRAIEYNLSKRRFARALAAGIV
ncbi:hypothetical protein OIDMADRAFT_141441 [Oidiodendron maius Zn]|uniref:Cell surface protein n=1 Tax=Oidiodendron maius (strain Zn) TaxID=913774 RepID=A0A0C3D398_OIDMZ|nr:hypothetical protein OIDMADRAFT_141441 [Oidiodendron maius Zn]